MSSSPQKSSIRAGNWRKPSQSLSECQEEEPDWIHVGLKCDTVLSFLAGLKRTVQVLDFQLQNEQEGQIWCNINTDRLWSHS